jgi:hypothetical protein
LKTLFTIQSLLCFCCLSFGNTSSLTIAANNAALTKNSDTIPKEEIIYCGPVEVDPITNSESWTMYLEENLKSVLQKAIAGGLTTGSYTVQVRFMIDRDGSICDVKAENDPGFGVAYGLESAIRNAPKWKPAQRNGRPVRAYKRQPFTFIVSSEDIKDSPEIADELIEASADTMACFEKVCKWEEPSIDSLVWTTYLEKRLQLLIDSARLAMMPKEDLIVRVKLLVNKDGSIEAAEAMNDPGFGLKSISEQLVTEGPRWHPARLHGTHIRAYTKITILFNYANSLCQRSGMAL